MLGIARSSTRKLRPAAFLLASALTVSVAIPLFSADFRLDYQPAAYAIKGAKIVPVAGDPIEVGTVVVRDGVIAAVGPVDRVEVPFDAEVIEGKGLIVYPGFIDLYTTSGQDAGGEQVAHRRRPDGELRRLRPAPDPESTTGTGSPPNTRWPRPSTCSQTLAEERRKLGFTDVLVAPGGAIATGQSALVAPAACPRRESILKARSPSTSPCGAPAAGSAAMTTAMITATATTTTNRHGFGTADANDSTQAPGTPIAPTAPRAPPTHARAPRPRPPAPAGRRGGGGGAQAQYPTSLMGVVAHLRQAMMDAQNHHERLAYYDRPAAPGRPTTRPSTPSTRPGPGPSRSGGRPTPATRSTGRSTWPRSSAPTP